MLVMVVGTGLWGMECQKFRKNMQALDCTPHDMVSFGDN